MEKIFEYIHEIIMEESFSKAAEKLYVTQPALSTAIKKYEEEVGRKIFDRSTSPISLTPAGELIHEHIHTLLEMEKNIFEKFKELDESLHGTIRFGATQYFITVVLSEFLYTFKSKYPFIRIELMEAASSELISMLNENKIDLFLSVGSFNAAKYKFSKGIRDTLYFAVPKAFVPDAFVQYALCKNDIVFLEKNSLKHVPTLSFLNAIPFIMLTKGNNLHNRCLALLEYENIHPYSIMEIAQLTTAHHLAARGFGATLTTDRLIKEQNDNPDIFYFSYDSEIMHREFNIVMNKKKYINKGMDIFIRELSLYSNGEDL